MTPITDQLQQIEALAFRHYPEDAEKRLAYRVEKLEERLREYAAMRLVVREMREE